MKILGLDLACFPALARNKGVAGQDELIQGPPALDVPVHVDAPPPPMRSTTMYLAGHIPKVRRRCCLWATLAAQPRLATRVSSGRTLAHVLACCNPRPRPWTRPPGAAPPYTWHAMSPRSGAYLKKI